MKNVDLRRSIVRLRERHARGELALVLGSRLASAAGAPLERGLIEALCRELGHEVQAAPSASWCAAKLPFDWIWPLGMVAGAYAALHGSEALRAKVASLIRDTLAQPGEIHAAVAALAAGPLDTVVSLGWDSLVADALTRARVPFDAVRSAKDLDATGRTRLIEAAGSERDPASLVLTTHDQVLAFGRSGEGSAMMEAIFASRTVLLIGAEPDHPWLAPAAAAGVAKGERRPVYVSFHPDREIVESAWEHQGWERIEPAKEGAGPRSAVALVTWLLGEIRGDRPIAGPKGGDSDLPPKGAAIAKSTKLKLKELHEVTETLAEIAAGAGINVATMAKQVGIPEHKLASPAGWNQLVDAVHAGLAEAHGEGRAAVRALVEAMSVEVPGSKTLKDLAKTLGE